VGRGTCGGKGLSNPQENEEGQGEKRDNSTLQHFGKTGQKEAYVGVQELKDSFNDAPVGLTWAPTKKKGEEGLLQGKKGLVEHGFRRERGPQRDRRGVKGDLPCPSHQKGKRRKGAHSSAFERRRKEGMGADPGTRWSEATPRVFPRKGPKRERKQIVSWRKKVRSRGMEQVFRPYGIP